jgi:hypothetical protein
MKALKSLEEKDYKRKKEGLQDEHIFWVRCAQAVFDVSEGPRDRHVAWLLAMTGSDGNLGHNPNSERR